MRAIHTLMAVAVGLLLCLSPLPGHAVEHSPEAVQRLVVGYLHAAKVAYERKHYTRAADQWRLAYRLWKEPALLFDRGQALRLADEREAALSQYEAYLKELPDAPNREEVTKFIAQLKKKRPKALETQE